MAFVPSILFCVRVLIVFWSDLVNTFLPSLIQNPSLTIKGSNDKWDPFGFRHLHISKNIQENRKDLFSPKCKTYILWCLFSWCFYPKCFSLDFLLSKKVVHSLPINYLIRPNNLIFSTLHWLHCLCVVVNNVYKKHITSTFTKNIISNSNTIFVVV